MQSTGSLYPTTNNIGAGSARQHLDLAARARLGPSCSLLSPHQSLRACLRESADSSRSVPPNQSMPSDGRVPKLQSWYTWCR